MAKLNIKTCTSACINMILGLFLLKPASKIYTVLQSHTFRVSLVEPSCTSPSLRCCPMSWTSPEVGCGRWSVIFSYPVFLLPLLGFLCDPWLRLYLWHSLHNSLNWNRGTLFILASNRLVAQLPCSDNASTMCWCFIWQVILMPVISTGRLTP